MKVSELRTKLYAFNDDAEVEILREGSYVGVYAGSGGSMVKDIVKVQTRKLGGDIVVPEEHERAVLIVGRGAEDDHRA